MVVVVVVICAVSDHDDTVNEAGNYCITDEYVVADIGDNAHLIAQQQRWDLNYREAAVYLQEGENNDKFYAHPSRQVFNPSCSELAGTQSKLFQVGGYSIQVVPSWQVLNPSCSRSAGIQSKLFRVGRYSIQVVPSWQVLNPSCSRSAGILFKSFGIQQQASLAGPFSICCSALFVMSTIAELFQLLHATAAVVPNTISTSTTHTPV